jgi:hypothetical protein
MAAEIITIFPPCHMKLLFAITINTYIKKVASATNVSTPACQCYFFFSIPTAIAAFMDFPDKLILNILTCKGF